MTRIVEKTDTGPLRLAKDEIAGDAVWICRCGLSRSQPFCDGSHKLTRDEAPNTLFQYVREPGPTTRVPVQVAHQGPPESPEAAAAEGAA